MRAWVERLTGVVAGGASLLFVVIVVISAIEVVARYGFDAPTIWVHELSVALAAAAFTIGGPVVHARRQHIAITFVLERLSATARRRLGILNLLLTLVFLCLLTCAAGEQALQSLDAMETSGTALNWPVPVTLKCLLALCSFWLLLQTVGHLATDLAGRGEERA